MSSTGGVLLGGASDRLSTTMTRKKSITYFRAGWLLKLPVQKTKQEEEHYVI